jgi:hypothetical protein
MQKLMKQMGKGGKLPGGMKGRMPRMPLGR